MRREEKGERKRERISHHCATTPTSAVHSRGIIHTHYADATVDCMLHHCVKQNNYWIVIIPVTRVNKAISIYDAPVVARAPPTTQRSVAHPGPQADDPHSVSCAAPHVSHPHTVLVG